MSEIKIGSPCWFYDTNRRVYRKDTNGSYGSPITREHWVEKAVVGETSRSWIVGHKGCDVERGTKVSKTEPNRMYAFNLKDVEDFSFVQDHGYRISEAVRLVRSADVLRQIAAIVNYVEK